MHACPRFISSDASEDNNNSDTRAFGHLMESEQQSQQYHEHQLMQHHHEQQQLPSPATETLPSSLSAALPSNPHIIYPQLSSAEHKSSDHIPLYLARPTLPSLATMDVEHSLELTSTAQSHTTKREAGVREFEPQEESKRQPRRCTSLKRRKLGEPSLKRPSLYNPSCPSSASTPSSFSPSPPSYSSSHTSSSSTTTTALNASSTPLPTPPSDTAAYEGILSTHPMDLTCHTEQHSRTDSNSDALSPVSPSVSMLTCSPFLVCESDIPKENGPQSQHDHNHRHCATQRASAQSFQGGYMVTPEALATATASPLNDDRRSNNTPPTSSSSSPSSSPSTPSCVQNNADQKQERDQGMSPLPLSPAVPPVHNSRNIDGGVDDGAGEQRNEVQSQQQQQSNSNHDFAHMDLLAHHSVSRQQEDKQAAEAAEAAAVALVAASAAAIAAANTTAATTTEASAQSYVYTNRLLRSTGNTPKNSPQTSLPFGIQQQQPRHWQFTDFLIHKRPFYFNVTNDSPPSSTLNSQRKTARPIFIGSRKRSFDEAIEMAQPLREEPSTLEQPGWLGAIKRRKIHHSAILWTSSLSPSPYVKLLAIRGFWDIMRSRVDLSWVDPKFTSLSCEFDDNDSGDEQDGDGGESHGAVESSDLDMDDQEDHHSDTFSSPSSGVEESDEGTDSCDDDGLQVPDEDRMDASPNFLTKAERVVDLKEQQKGLWTTTGNCSKGGEEAMSHGTSMTSATPDMASVLRTTRRGLKLSKRRSRRNSDASAKTMASSPSAEDWDFHSPTLSLPSSCRPCIRRVVTKHPNTVLLFRGLWAEEERNRRQRQQIPDGVHKPSRSKIINSRPLSRAHGPIHLGRGYSGPNEQPNQQQSQQHQRHPRRRAREASVTMAQARDEEGDGDEDGNDSDEATSDEGEVPAATREEQERQQQQDYEMQLRRKHGLKTPLRSCLQTLDRLRTHLLEPWPKEEAKAKDECTRILHRMREQLNVVINLQIHLRSMMKSAPNQFSFLLSIRHPGQVSMELLQALYGPQFIDSSAFRTIEQLLWGSDGYHRRAGTSSVEASHSHAEEEDYNTLASQQEQEQQNEEQHYHHNHHHPHHHYHRHSHQQIEYSHQYDEHDESCGGRETYDMNNHDEEDDEGEDEDMTDDRTTDMHSSMEATVDSLGIH
ncbi:hypothetical protein BGZ73_001896 [Actinomortierella ambigua]|nr:hypothetical protein BGZ73_001896 [Actinomortierella ambigua]